MTSLSKTLKFFKVLLFFQTLPTFSNFVVSRISIYAILFNSIYMCCFELWDFFLSCCAICTVQMQSDLFSDDIIEFTAIFIGQ